MAIGFFRALHTGAGAAARAKFAQDMTTYASVIVILTAAVGAGTVIGNTLSSKPTFEQGVAEKMETLDATLKNISTTATTISTTATDMSGTLADLLPTIADLLKSKDK